MLRRRLPRMVAIAFALWLLMPVSHAHVVEQMYVEFRVDGDRWEAEVLFDAAYALPEMRADEGAPAPARSWLLNLSEEDHARVRAGAEELLREYLVFDWDAEPLEWGLSMVDYEKSPPDFPVMRLDIAVTRVLASGALGAAPGALTLSVNEDCPLDFVVSIDGGAKFLSIKPGASGRCWELAGDGRGSTAGVGPLWVGFTHVLPGGWDHVLFILAIFFLSRSWRDLLAQSLVFTLAHSVTLALVTCGLLAPGGAWVEVVIALSIVFVALENLWRNSVSRARYLTIFGFGLIHGMGFASALSVGLAGRVAQNLVLANVGIELAQVVVLVVVWLLTSPVYRSRSFEYLRKWGSIAIALAGLWYAVRL